MCCISYNLIFFSPANTGFRFPSTGLRFERSSGNSLVVGRGQRHGGAGGEGEQDCSHWGSEADRGKELKTLCSSPCWACFAFSPSYLRVMTHLELVPSPMLEEETSEGPITPKPPQAPWVTHRRVRGGFASDPYPPPSPPPAHAHPTRHPLPGRWPALSPFPDSWERSESPSPHSQVRSLFTGTSNIYLKRRAAVGMLACSSQVPPHSPCGVLQLHCPSFSLGHLLFFNSFREDLPCSQSLLMGLVQG